MSLLRAATRRLALRQAARLYASTSTTLAPASLVRAPNATDTAPDGPELVDASEAHLSITERAAEHLRAMSKNKDAALRIAVESGGCHGYQYKLELAKSREPDDYHFAHPSIQPANVLVDAVSLGLVKGSTLDYVTELIGSSFRITENPQAKGNGCGCGVSWEAKF